MLSRPLSDCQSLNLNVMIQVLQFVKNSQLPLEKPAVSTSMVNKWKTTYYPVESRLGDQKCIGLLSSWKPSGQGLDFWFRQNHLSPDLQPIASQTDLWAQKRQVKLWQEIPDRLKSKKWNGTLPINMMPKHKKALKHVWITHTQYQIYKT